MKEGYYWAKSRYRDDGDDWHVVYVQSSYPNPNLMFQYAGSEQEYPLENFIFGPRLEPPRETVTLVEPSNPIDRFRRTESD